MQFWSHVCCTNAITMATEKKLKYNIKAQIDLLPREVKVKDLLKILAKHGIEKVTFYRDQKIKADSDFSIPVDRLNVYAHVFDVTMQELINTDVKIKSIHQELLSKKSKIKTPLA